MSFNKRIRNIRFFIEYCFVLFFFRLVKILPRVVINGIAQVAGTLMYWIPLYHKVSNANLAIAFPGKDRREIKSIARRSLVHLVRALLDFFRISQNPEYIATECSYPDHCRKLCEPLHNKGNGLIFVTPHLGSWEIAGLIMKQAGYPFAVVAKTIRNPYLDKLINSGRTVEGSHVITAKGAVKGMVKSLKSGSMVATLIDQNTRIRDGGVFIEFFSLPVPASRTPALFGRRFNVPLLVGGSVYKDGKYEIFMEPLPKPIEEYEDDIEVIQDLMRVTEAIIREYPEQYLWFYKRFQNIPREADEEMIRKYPFYARLANDRFYDANATKSTS